MRKNPYILHTYCEGDEAWTRRLTATIFHCTSPQGERSSTAAVAEVHRRNILNNDRNQARKIATEGLIWPLREGREIWGADGVFASIRRRHENVEGNIRAINQLNDVINTSFRQSAHPGAFPKHLSLRSIEWTYERELRLYLFRLKQICTFQCMILQYVNFNLLNKLCCFGSLNIKSFPEVKQVVNWGRCWNPINLRSSVEVVRKKRKTAKTNEHNHSGKRIR